VGIGFLHNPAQPYLATDEVSRQTTTERGRKRTRPSDS
jgi:hypothetical protein